MLFTDGDYITSSELIAIDPQVKNVTTETQLILDATPPYQFNPANNQVLCVRAINEVAEQIQQVNQGFSGYLPPFMMPYSQSAAVLNIVGPAVNRIRLGLGQVVTTNQYAGWDSALKVYTLYYALFLIFQAAFYRKVEDRYEKKMNLYDGLCKKTYWPRFFSRGANIVYKPLACPGAPHEPAAGFWGNLVSGFNSVSTVSGTNINGALDYYVAVTWVDNSKYVSSVNTTAQGNGESDLSAIIRTTVPISQVIHIDISTLNPPDGTTPTNFGVGQGVFTRGNATGWNVWIAPVSGMPQGGPFFLQNPSPLPIATKTYTLAGPPVLTGTMFPGGQLPEAALTMQRMMIRG